MLRESSHDLENLRGNRCSSKTTNIGENWGLYRKSRYFAGFEMFCVVLLKDRRTYKVGEEVSGLAHPKLVLIAEPSDEVDVGLDSRRVGLRG